MEEDTNLTGILILFIGPSGSGKGTLLETLRTTHPDFVFPVSCTTREPRPDEKEGVTYYFITKERFTERIEQGDFLEWAEVDGNYYGTLISEIIVPLRTGGIVVREVEVQGARAIQKHIPKGHIRTIYVYAGEWDTLLERIQERSMMSEEELVSRKTRYDNEITFKHEADYIVNNLDGEQGQAYKDLEKVITNILAEQHIHD